MKLYELKKPKEIDDFRKGIKHLNIKNHEDNRHWMEFANDLLYKYGFYFVGKGHYGTVLVSDEYPFALKIFRKDDGYKSWIDFCRSQQSNPYIPKIRGKIIKVAHGIFAVRIEKLNHFDPTSNHPSIKKFYNAFGNFEVGEDYQTNDKNIIYILDDFENHLDDMDMGWSNVMLRDTGHLVIIDPYAGD